MAEDGITTSSSRAKIVQREPSTLDILTAELGLEMVGALGGAAPLDTLVQYLYKEKMVMHNVKKEYVISQAKVKEDAAAKLKALKTIYDRLHAQLQAKLLRLQEISSQNEKLARPSVKESTAFTRAQRLVVSIKEGEKRSADALSQQAVLLHMVARCKDETTCLDRELEELQAIKGRLDQELREQSASTKAMEREIRNEEMALKKVNENLEKRGHYQQVESQELAKMAKFRSHQIAKQERRAKHRQKIVSQALGQIEVDEINAIKTTCMARKLYNNLLDTRLTSEEEKLSTLEASFQQIKNVSGCTDIDEIVKKFLTRRDTNQHLKWMVDEVRNTLEALKKLNEDYNAKLKKVKGDAHPLAKTREVYHEVDVIDSELKHALSENEECKIKTNRLYLLLEELRCALSRYLSKIEGNKIPLPAKTELPDYVSKLNAKLTEMMAAVSQHVGDIVPEGGNKSTSTSTTKASSPRAAQPQQPRASYSRKDYGSGSRVEENDQSTVLPYAVLNTTRVSDMLYKKLMTTEIDTTARNLRVASKETAADLARKMKVDSYLVLCGKMEDPNNPRADDLDDVGVHLEDDDDPNNVVVDRTTVKKISSMIISKNRKEKGQPPPSNPGSPTKRP